MKVTQDRRRYSRTPLDSPEVAILFSRPTARSGGVADTRPVCPLFVDLLERSADGAAVGTKRKLEPDAGLVLQFYDKTEKRWELVEAEARWSGSGSTQNGYHRTGLRLDRGRKSAAGLASENPLLKSKPLAEDYEFFRRTRLLKSIPRGAVCSMLNSISFRHVPASERFIVQGAPGDRCFIIQRGVCVVQVEKNGSLTAVARLRAGDIVGEMAMLTDEPRSAHVDAESDMDLWVLAKEQFGAIAGEFPELRTFLTELLAHWFKTRTVTAERRIGKYILTDIVGKGGYSLVYRGLHEALHMPVAIKMMKHNMAMDPRFIAKFRCEAMTIARFSHENILQVYDIEECYRTIFIVTEYLEGIPLRGLLENMVRLPAGQVVHYLLQICSGLNYAHKLGIVHQDIKPENIFILPNDRVKILDFGLACASGSENAFDGTPTYMAPEQIECLPVDQRTDVYALGLMAYEMLTGRIPFENEDAWTAMNMRVDTAIPDPAAFVPGLPDALRDFILKACESDPARRHQSMAEASDALKSLAETLGVHGRDAPKPNRKMATLALFYSDEQKSTLNREMTEFCSKMQALGVACKAADFDDV